MYVTRPLSMYRKDRSALSLPPPEGLNSGILVFEDEDFSHKFIEPTYGTPAVPFPQNFTLKRYISLKDYSTVDFIFIPAINQPLSSNIYYAITANGYFKGTACTCSREKDTFKSCFCFKYVCDVPSTPFAASNVYQQFHITSPWPLVLVECVASDGYAPYWLRDIAWRNHNFYYKIDFHYKLDDALGLDHSLRKQLPDFNFPTSRENSHAIEIGKWYCPFIFVKEMNMELGAQMDRSMFYEMTLKQQWIRIFTCDSNSVEGKFVFVDVDVESEVIDVLGTGTPCYETQVADGVIWYEGFDKEGMAASLGLCREIVERMKWEQENFGWVGNPDEEGKAKVKFLEDLEGKDGWKKFGSYILVERYVLRRLDREKSLVLTYEFRHTHQVRCKWE